MSGSLRWRAGDASLRAALEPLLLDPSAAGPALTLVREQPGRRRLARLRLDDGQVVFLKHFPANRGGHALRERLKHLLGLGTAAREWRALRQLQRAGIPVPTPRALARLPGGAHVLVTRYLEGRTLEETLASAPKAPDRRALLDAVAELVSRLHAAGWVHWDLHHGNILVTAEGPVLLDLQASLPFRTRIARHRDLGELDHSLSRTLSLCDRVRLRARCMGLTRPFDATARQQLRSVGRWSRARRRAYAASRARRSLRPGRRFAAFAWGSQHGLRLKRFPEATLVAALEAVAGGRVLKDDPRSRVTAVLASGRALVVKEYRAGGVIRRLSAGLRGSAARRAWLGGHGLRALGVAAAAPLAWLEKRRLGLPAGSVLVMEDVSGGGRWPADRCEGLDPSALANALGRLALRLHAQGVDHRDLKASHVFVAGREGAPPETHLIDLEDVRFPLHLGDGRRLRALAQLNASLPDAAIPDEARRRVFLGYATALPFRRGTEAALRRIVTLSVSRAHRWSGGSCRLA